MVTNTAMTDDRHSQSEAEMGEREGKEMATGLHDYVTHSHQKHQSCSMAARVQLLVAVTGSSAFILGK